MTEIKNPVHEAGIITPAIPFGKKRKEDHEFKVSLDNQP